MRKRIIIIGGGVAGLSAAQALAERQRFGDFELHVYEANPSIAGGKARSLPVPNSSINGRLPLPAEHGFRVFLGSYKHITDTMKRIPYKTQSVYDNLVNTSRLFFGRFDKPSFIANSRAPRHLHDFQQIGQSLFELEKSGLTVDDIRFFSGKLWQIATSCYERRVAEYEKITWWHFIEADKRSLAYQNLLANGISRSITANDPRQGNAKTLGDFTLDSFLSVIDVGAVTSKILNGPTNEVWIDPWLTYLQQLGVQYRFGAKAKAIHCENGRVASVEIDFADDYTAHVTGDYFIFAVPVEVMAKLLTTGPQPHPILTADPSLAGIIELQKDVAWMNGLIFYLTEDVKIVHGHQMYVESPWALTGVSQIQFWQESGYDIGARGNGQVRGVLSMIISNWNEPGILHQKPAKACTPEEIKEEVWEQMKRALNRPGQTAVLRDDMLNSWYLDADIVPTPHQNGSYYINEEPLLIHPVNRWRLRPNAHTQIPNMYLAADYVRTNMDAATMEAANEAARRAVNRLLDEMGIRAPRCRIWQLWQYKRFAPARWLDKQRFRQGLPWQPSPF